MRKQEAYILTLAPKKPRYVYRNKRLLQGLCECDITGRDFEELYLDVLGLW